MCCQSIGALAPLNLLVVLGANWPAEVIGEIRGEDVTQKLEQPHKETGVVQSICEDSIGGPPPEMPGLHIDSLDQEQANGRCSCTCPGMVMVPQELVERSALLRQFFDEKERSVLGDKVRCDNETGSITLVMSRDNIAALVVIGSLSFLGAIYLYKICTRRHCVCKLCRNQYRIWDLLGSGGYGEVYLVDRMHDAARFVAKKIPVTNITEVDEYSKEAKELITLRHQHIVSYEEDFVHVDYCFLEPRTFFIIIMEYCPEGDLKQKIELDFNSFTEDWVRLTFAQLLQAVQYLHSKNVIHRDLKSQNVFLAHDGRVRLGDFGLCRRTRSPTTAAPSLTHAGTDCYMAPEMLSSSRYGKPADMWSLGCVLYESCAGQFMWELDGILGAMVMKDAHTVQQLLHDNVVACIGNVVRSLMKRLLSVSPMARPTATTCIRKKLFKRGFPLSKQSFGTALGELDPQDLTPPHDVDRGSDAVRWVESQADDLGEESEDDGVFGETHQLEGNRHRDQEADSGSVEMRATPLPGDVVPKRRVKHKQRKRTSWR